ncbi:hypothetical protein OPV22_021414 [Ensete ventricosum]|uniref:Uncharacterized protein n=1 Tax=Ensete ventricosum TaxID=4639 RepID=A0AAV8QH26_ENSVE|nr:hypothetical protein OPV22_021414 [Ensete ventricosum]
MSSSAAGKPPQGSSTAAISPDSPSPIQVVSTSASPFDESPPHIDANSLIRKPLSLWSGLYHSSVTNALWEACSKDGAQIGKLLEDLDVLAGAIAAKLLHVARIVMMMIALQGRSCDVTWVGHSSIEVQNEVTQQDDSQSSDPLALTANFTFVVCDSRTGNGPTMLIPENLLTPELRTSEISNTFFFTFTGNLDALKNGLKISQCSACHRRRNPSGALSEWMPIK